MCMNIVYPALAEVYRDRPHDLPKTLVKFQWAYDGLITFLSAALVTGAPAIIGMLYDNRYRDAGWMLSILAVGTIGCHNQVVEECYQAVGAPKYATLANFIRLCTLIAGIVVGRHFWGVEGAIV